MRSTQDDMKELLKLAHLRTIHISESDFLSGIGWQRHSSKNLDWNERRKRNRSGSGHNHGGRPGIKSKIVHARQLIDGEIRKDSFSSRDKCALVDMHTQ